MLGSSRRNLQSAGSARQGSRRPAAAEAAAKLELPPYQEPRLPLTDTHQLKLRELSSSRLNASLQKHANTSAKLLAESVFAINERATNRKEHLEKMIKKRRGSTNDEREADHDAEIERFRQKADEMKAAVEPLTLKVEKAMRDTLDLQAELEDEKEVLKELPQTLLTAQAEQAEKTAQAHEHAPGDEEEEEEEPPEVPGVSIHRLIVQDREQKAKAYAEMNNFQKYARNNTYIDFKRNWHDGLNPGDEIPVPDPKTWFDSDGQPKHVTADGEDGSDDDFHISKEVRSVRCPLSLVEMTEPYTCRRCKHSFQKDAIIDYLRSGTKKCPQTGCHLQNMSMNDIYFDELLLRRMKRAKQAKNQREQASDQEDEMSQEDATVEAPVEAKVSDEEADKVDEEEEPLLRRVKRAKQAKNEREQASDREDEMSQEDATTVASVEAEVSDEEADEVDEEEV